MLYLVTKHLEIFLKNFVLFFQEDDLPDLSSDSDDWVPPPKRKRKQMPAYPRRVTRSKTNPGRTAMSVTVSESPDNTDEGRKKVRRRSGFTEPDSEDEPSQATGSKRRATSVEKSPTMHPADSTSTSAPPKRIKATARKSTTRVPAFTSKRRISGTSGEQGSRGTSGTDVSEVLPKLTCVTSLDQVDNKQLFSELISRKAVHPCECGLIFSTITAYYLHVGCHNRENTKACNYCSYVARNWMDFHSHFFHHSNKRK